MPFIGPESDSAPAAGGGFVGPDPEVQTPGNLESFGRGVANNVPLAPQAIASGEAFFGHGDYSHNLADWNANAAEAKAAHPVSYGAGATAGTLAPAMILGPAAEAAPILTGAGLGAASAISNTDLEKEPLKAAEQGAVGAVTGGALGKVGDLMAEAGPGLADKATKINARGFGLAPKLLGNMSPAELSEYGSFGRANNLLDQDVEGALARAKGLKEAAGKTIGDIGADALPVGDVTPHVTDILDKARELEKIEGAEPKVRALYQGGRNIINAKTFQDLQAIKTNAGEDAFDAFHQVKDPIAAKIYTAAKNAMNDTITSAPAEYQNAMKQYKMANDAVAGLTKKLGNQRNGAAGEGLGFMGRILGRMPGQSNPAINLPTAAAIGAAGHPMMGLMAATPSINNPAVQAGTLDALAKALPNLSRPALMAIIERLTGKNQ